MTADGNPATWTDRFRSLDTRFLQRVVAVWPRCVDVLQSHPHEDAITINLVHLLRKDPGARRLFHWLAFQYVPFGLTGDVTAYSKGRIDMALLVDREHERYLAYECKRLNVIRQGRRHSLATSPTSMRMTLGPRPGRPMPRGAQDAWRAGSTVCPSRSRTSSTSRAGSRPAARRSGSRASLRSPRRSRAG